MSPVLVATADAHKIQAIRGRMVKGAASLDNTLKGDTTLTLVYEDREVTVELEQTDHIYRANLSNRVLNIHFSCGAVRASFNLRVPTHGESCESASVGMRSDVRDRLFAGPLARKVEAGVKLTVV